MLLHSDGHSIEKNIPTDSEEDLGNSFPSLIIFFFIRKCVVKLKTGPNQEKHTHTEIKKARNNLFFKEAVKVGEISIDIGTEVRETNTPSEAPVMSVFISCNRCV